MACLLVTVNISFSLNYQNPFYTEKVLFQFYYIILHSLLGSQVHALGF